MRCTVPSLCMERTGPNDAKLAFLGFSVRLTQLTYMIFGILLKSDSLLLRLRRSWGLRDQITEPQKDSESDSLCLRNLV